MSKETGSIIKSLAKEKLKALVAVQLNSTKHLTNKYQFFKNYSK
jgi:hypothetical protein